MNLAFTNGVISSAFDRLLNNIHFKNFENVSKGSFLELLKTHQYGLSLKENFEQIMLEEEVKHKNFLKSLVDSRDILFDCLYMKFNHLFLSSLLKSYHLGVAYTNFIENLTTYNETNMIDYVIHGNKQLLDLDEKVMLDQLIEQTKNLSSQEISDKVMLYLHHDLLKRLNKADKYLKQYYEVQTMIENVLFMTRAIKYKFEDKYIFENLLDNSLIDKSILYSYRNSNLVEFASYLELHFTKEVSEVYKDDSAFFFRNVTTFIEGFMTKLISDFGLKNDGYALIIYFTAKKREEIIKLKQLYYGVK